MVMFLSNKYRLRILCARQIQNKIQESVYTLIVHQIRRFGLEHRFKITDSSIKNLVTGSEFIFLGIHRSFDEIKSLEGIDIAWFEEAHALSREQWVILEPTFRKEGSEIWIVFNPGLSTDFVYQNFVVNEQPNSVVRKINYDENPFLSSTMLETIEAVKRSDEKLYRHVYLGEPIGDTEESVIRMDWLVAAVDAHKKLGVEICGRWFAGFDIADSGDDKCATIYRRGGLVVDSELWSAGEHNLNASYARVWGRCRELGAHLIYDSIGVGASCGSKIRELNADSPSRVTFEPFNAGGAVLNPKANYLPKVTNQDYFANLKAQSWWGVADRLRKTHAAIVNGEPIKPGEIISISPDMPNREKLFAELCIPRREFDKSGRVIVESKQALAKRGIPSPNLADAFIMALNPKSAPLRIPKELL